MPFVSVNGVCCRGVGMYRSWLVTQGSTAISRKWVLIYGGGGGLDHGVQAEGHDRRDGTLFLLRVNCAPARRALLSFVS